MGIFKHLVLTGSLLLVAVPGMANQTFSSDKADFRLETVAQNLEHPWSLAFMPDGSMLVTEREGELRMIRNGSLVNDPISGVPELVVSGQGGLLDVILHPDFEQNQVLFLSYAHRNRDGMTTRVARARLSGDRLTDVEVIFEALPRSGGGRHFAGRMEFDRDGNLYVAVGDRGEMDRAQDNSDDAGGVHRITPDGGPAPGNPFLDTSGVNDTFYTTGNRNIQGMTIHPETGEIWSHEHGPRGGDEINIIRAGTDYGWPTITYGIDYSGLPITDKTKKEGMAQPLHYWDPSIAPSGMAFYTGDLFPEWQGDLFVGALKMRKLVRLRIQDGEVTEEEDLLTDLDERIRDVRMGPDGALWLLTDSPRGKVYRMVPAQ
ncbi:Glucose/arabinose dehydrogenase, beta-propeller fold [Marinobacter sp. DSM 26671]|jgi:glucose/arabinose dehydrogenase|uniref:Glucose sorbosone dehydrogenase n=1 Tax=Marinobacter manganoxydans MnI7-9 TaxID=1094979 RepID=G6YXC6_9GAMM|nr:MULTISPECIES: PQQ-dependent sugar dehydrogenase [Marinobacter]EHJ02988.1 glucose sorbosone dehydrogenase [Marinobacter manganoxydans MnI7-9]MAK50419.1 glucose dehydrogenase [Marinobacter sp.]MBI46935.1 glucose dehydrogenase [Marinobacter sp.]SFE01319.1 Glucose/arabinose dehydrogenase, beta-propeller fold [Marinobacter sp. DSM 26671]|tara:strand:+ start:771 stop:1892 length:1122 start_codon:yes stop_codon:yes gene_type:complete